MASFLTLHMGIASETNPDPLSLKHVFLGVQPSWRGSVTEC